MSTLLGLLLLGLGSGGSSPVAHPDSQSLTEVWITKDQLKTRFEVQLESLAEVLPGIDQDGDGALSSIELQESRGDVLDYLGEHLRVRGALGDAPLQPLGLGERVLSLVNQGEPLERDGRVWLGVTSTSSLVMEVNQLAVTIDPFFETSPGHLSTLIVHWPDALPDLEILSVGQATYQGTRGPSLRIRSLRDALVVGVLGLAPWIILLLAAGSARAMWTVLVWLLGAFLAPFWVSYLGLELELRTLGLACAVGAVYLGSDVALNPGKRNRWLAAAVLGTSLGAMLAQHPSLLSPVLAPASTRGIFLGVAPLAALLLAVPLIGFARKHMTCWGWVVALVGLGVFMARAAELLPAGS